jgi:hypothetical protein
MKKARNKRNICYVDMYVQYCQLLRTNDVGRTYKNKKATQKDTTNVTVATEVNEKRTILCYT